MTLHNFGHVAHLCGKGGEHIVGGPVQQHLNEDHQRPVQRHRVENGGELPHNAAGAQPLHPLETGGGRQAAASRQLLIRDPSIFLQ